MTFDQPNKAYVQGTRRQNGITPQDIPPGYISWEEHEEAWTRYRANWPNHQTAVVINMRGGFDYWELVALLGHPPTTWRPRDQTRYRDFVPPLEREKL